jgi:hypothetical protein
MACATAIQTGFDRIATVALLSTINGQIGPIALMALKPERATTQPHPAEGVIIKEQQLQAATLTKCRC